ncbi:MAG: hypothetical protein MJ247_03575 [Alphaproteobacteria bacterium]|nr:hypothetical protein [Alphaproteobacteria bacterium]
MNLPSYIRTMLQVNYYVSEEDLNKQFFEMPDAVKQLITSKCMINGKFKTEEELASVSHEQMLEDIDSDIPLHNPTTNTSDNDYTSKSSINNFVNNKTAFDSYVKKAVSSSSNELEEVSSLLAVKRLCNSDSKTFSISFDEYEKAKKEVYTELVVKDWMTRYIDSHPMTKKNAETYQQNIAETTAMIHQMVSTNKEADIAKRFDIPTDEKTVSELRGATLAVAMSEVTCFANKIKDKVDQSSFVKEVKRLDNSFKEKYPKTYCVSKIVGSLGAGIALGPVCSAFRAATTINGMRKDYAKIKEIEGEKASFWKYMRSKEGRQKLMTTGQNFLRMIPGVRPLGMAIGAIKNSDGLVSSVKDVKKNGGNKQRWAKIAGCTIGLLAVSAAAAYANDDVADAVNSFVGEHITPTLEHMAEAINIGNHDVDLSNVDTSSPSIDVSDVHSNLAENANIGDISPELASNSVADNIEHLSWAERFKNFISGKSSNSDSLTENAHLNVDATENGVQVVAHNDGSFARIDEVDGKVNASGAINQTARLGEDGVTLTHAYGDTQTGDVGAEITLNQSGAKIYANHYGAEDLHDNAGVDFEVGKSVRVDGTGFHARAGSLNIGEDRTLDTSLDANSHGVVADATMRHNGDNLNVDINTTNGSGQVVHFDDNSFQRVDVADGKINASGAFNQTARLGEDGVTLTHAHGDTQTGDVGAEITLNQSGAKVYANHYGAEDLHDNAGIDFEVGKSVRVDGTGFHARAGSVDLGNNTTMDSALDVDKQGTIADTKIRHDGDVKSFHFDTHNNSAQQVHMDDTGSYQKVEVNNGKVEGSYSVNRTVDTSKPGTTVTHSSMDSKGNAKFRIVDNQSGKGVTVTRNDDHSAQITFEDGNNGTSKIRINQNGQMFVAGEDGNLYKVSDTRQVANIAGKLLGGLLKGRGR